ncbi:MAG: hypothetical protein EYC62_02560 [Alphaproteobacteria bacterium]|nr:MAG: hypothetical protein EYC62_02560 [Alphaproteobacteria bacterium]
MKKLSLFSFVILAGFLFTVSASHAGTSGLNKMSESTNALNTSTASKVESAKPATASGDQSKSAIKTTSKFKEKSWKRGSAPFGRRSGAKSESGNTESKK